MSKVILALVMWIGIMPLGMAYATEIILRIPDAQADKFLGEVYTRLGANADRNGMKDKTDSEKLAWCFQEVINTMSYVSGHKHTLAEYGVTIEVRR